jgi:hypothetical protein
MSAFIGPPPGRRGGALWPVIGLFRDPGRFAATFAQIVKLRPAHAAAADHGDRIDIGRMDREHPLDPFAKRDLAHGEAASDAVAALAGDANALEVLHPGARPFGHLEADPHRIPGLEVGNLLAQRGDLFGLDRFDHVHDRSPSSPGARARFAPQCSRFGPGMARAARWRQPLSDPSRQGCLKTTRPGAGPGAGTATV